MKKYIFGFLAVVLISFVSAFTIIKTHNVPEHKVLTTWYFDGTVAQIKDAAAWRKTGSAPVDCQSSGMRPCSIDVTATTQTQLQAYLDPLTAQQVTAQSAQKRP